VNIRHGISDKDISELIEMSDCDYSNVPTPILLQPSICTDCIEQIKSYNDKNGTNYGYCTSSILSLIQKKTKKKGENKYKEKFQLEESDEGTEFLIKFLKMIEDSDSNNKHTVMKMIEKTQSNYNMDPSRTDDPKLFLIFLPMGQKIDTLMKTLIRFINEHKLWDKYHVCYSNSTSSSDDNETEYMEFVEKEMNLTKQNKKKGCILLLGNQGKLGITYHNCDVTIHLDNGTNIDDAKQSYYRALTDRPGKTIGINVDLNIQRVYMYVMNRIREYKRDKNDNRSYSEILQHLYTENLFIFNPTEFNFDGYTDKRIEYFKMYETKMKQELTVDIIVDQIQCNDTLRDYIKKFNMDDGLVIVNSELNGGQQDCPKPHKDKEQVDSILVVEETDNDQSEIQETSIDENKPIINISKNTYKYLAILSGLFLIEEFINPENKNKSREELLKIPMNKPNEYKIIRDKLMDDFGVEERDINIIYDGYIETMTSGYNQDILDDIFELYARSSPSDLRKIIEKHFIPTKEQRKNNAEIATPVELVDEMLDKIPCDYFKTINKTFEPCCGKGNFVLGIFDKYYEGLSYIVDESERCRIIIEECIYFADLDSVNIYITRKLLMCHAIFKLSGGDQWDFFQTISKFNYNCYVGDTLELDIREEWDIDVFSAVIGNPPYQETNKSGKSKHGKSNLWTKFIEYSFKNMNKNGYLLFITPSSWMNGTVSCYKEMINRQIHCMNVGDCKKYFNGVGSTFSYYLIEDSNIYKPTEYICKYKDSVYSGEMQLNENIKMLPQLLSDDMFSIMNKVFIWSNEKKFPRKDLIKEESREQTDEYRYPFISYIKKDGSKDIKFTKTKLPTQESKKILLFRSGYLNPTYDDGINGVGDNIHYTEVESSEEGHNLLKLLNSDLYKFLFSVCKTSQFNNGRVMNWLYRKNPEYVDINEYFKLTEREIEFLTNYYSS
tara:strand:+ start:119 stop:2965 length:2847 start_codon:yes stop_codon:yes gene_type:complete